MLPEGFMRSLVVVVAAKAIEGALLGGKARGGRILPTVGEAKGGPYAPAA